MAVKISVVDSYQYFGSCVKLENDKIEILVTKDVGPRIIYFGAKGGENLFRIDEERVNVNRSPLLKELYGEDAEYHFYGGHRAWLAPQNEVYTECPDNDPVEVEEIENGIRLTCPEEKVIGFILRMTIVMDPEKPQITVTCDFTNTSDAPKKNAVWQITQVAKDGVGFYPAPSNGRKGRPVWPKSLKEIPAVPPAPTKTFVMFLGSYLDPRMKIDDDYVTLEQSSSDVFPIKFGYPLLEGYAMYAVNGQMLRFDFPHHPGGVYTDSGCSFETYSCAQFQEVESLGEYLEFQKGETISHTEVISVQPLKAEIPDLNDRASVRQFVELHK